jgi:hypothetical protein
MGNRSEPINHIGIISSRHKVYFQLQLQTFTPSNFYYTFGQSLPFPAG